MSGAMLCLSSVVAAAIYIPTVSGVYQYPASFVPHPSALAILSAPQRQHSIAFVDNSNDLKDTTLHKSFTTKRGTAGGMASLKDVEAYHEMVSAAVDFTSIYLRNGIVTGEIAPELIGCSRSIMLFLYIVSFEIINVLDFPDYLPQRQDPFATSIRTLGDSSFIIFLFFRLTDLSYHLQLSCQRK